jgi:predicted short-subunit dehydrogenase-like oxidoreductase (DUF2520 family)
LNKAKSSTSLTLSCIGAGRAGKTLCRLFAEQQSEFDLSIQQIINRSESSAAEAVSFIGQGEAATSFDNLLAADIWLIATPDNEIAAVSERLAQSAVLRKGVIVFHCSGSLSSEVLSSEVLSSEVISSQILSSSADSVYRASVHPIHSFAHPQNSLTDFAGSACGVEGDRQACDILTALFTAIGGRCFALNADKKALYHAATVMACNNLISLLSLSEQMLEAADVGSAAADVESAAADNILQPLIENSLNNYFRSGAVAALTGPISRGDSKTVASHIESLKAHPDWQRIYSNLGEIAVSLSAQQGFASDTQLETISSLLARANNHE